MPNTLVHYPPSLASELGKPPSGGETFTVTCYTCGMPSSTEWAQRVLTRPVSPPKPFFPFLSHAKHAAGTYISQEDGTTFLCAFCHASLESQWNLFEKSSTPVRERQYNTNNFICAVCSVKTYRKRVRALPFQEFPFLAKERPAGSLTLGNNPLAVVCLDCSETLWAQSAEYDRWGLPVQKRHFNWMSRPPPPENSMEATVARLPSGETQLPRCPPTEPLVRRKDSVTVQKPLHDFSQQIPVPSHSTTTNSHRPTRTSLSTIPDKRSSLGCDSAKGSNSRKSSTGSLPDTPSLIGPSVPIVTVAPMASTTTTTSTSYRKDSGNLMAVYGLSKLESQKTVHKPEFRSINGYPHAQVPPLYPSSNLGLGYGNYGIWAGAPGHLHAYPYHSPPLLETVTSQSQWPWIPSPIANTDFVRYQAYLSSIASSNYANAVESFFSQTHPHPLLQTPENVPIHPEGESSIHETHSRKRSVTALSPPSNSIPKLTRHAHQPKPSYKNPVSEENKAKPKEMCAAPFKKRHIGKIEEDSEAIDLSRQPEPSIQKKTNSNFLIANLCSENMSPPAKRTHELASPNRNTVIVNLRSPFNANQSQANYALVNHEAPNLLSALLSPSTIPQKAQSSPKDCRSDSDANSATSTPDDSVTDDSCRNLEKIKNMKSDEEIYEESLQEFKTRQAEEDSIASKESEDKEKFLKLFELVKDTEKTDIELKVLMSRYLRKTLPPIKFRAESPKDEEPMSDEVEKQVLVAAFEDPSLKKSNSNPQLTNFMSSLDMKPATKSEKYRREETWRFILAERMLRFKRGGRKLSGDKRPWDTMANIVKHLNPGNGPLKRRYSLPPTSNRKHNRPMRSLSLTLPPDPSRLTGIQSSDLLATVEQSAAKAELNAVHDEAETQFEADNEKFEEKSTVPCSPVISYPKYVPSYASKKSPSGERNLNNVLNVPVVPRLFPLAPNNHNENSEVKTSPTSVPCVDSIVQRFTANWKETKEEMEKILKMKTERRIPIPELKRLRKALNAQQSEIRAMVKWLKEMASAVE